MTERPDAVVRVMIVEDDLGMFERFAAALVRDAVTRAAALGLLRQGEDKVPDCQELGCHRHGASGRGARKEHRHLGSRTAA